jgi:hypothetical protein
MAMAAQKGDLLAGAAGLFEKGDGGLQEAAVDVKALRAKIGELTLENDFLEGALVKACMRDAQGDDRPRARVACLDTGQGPEHQPGQCLLSAKARSRT